MIILDIGVYISIALAYNIFAHSLITSLYKDIPYGERYNKTIVMLLIFGVGALILSKLLLRDGQEYGDSVVSMGLGIGGGLLIFSALIGNWENMATDLKMYISAAIFIVIFWTSYNYYDK